MIDPIFLLSILILGLLLAHHRRTVERLERELAGALLARDTAREAAKTAYTLGHGDATNEVNARRDAEAQALREQAWIDGWNNGFKEQRQQRGNMLPRQVVRIA